MKTEKEKRHTYTQSEWLPIIQTHCPVWQSLAACGFRALEKWLMEMEMCCLSLKYILNFKDSI